MPSIPLTEPEIEQRLQTLNGWSRQGGSIGKVFMLESYVAGLAFATAAGLVCDGLNHHPDISIGWKKVQIRFTTHDAGSQLTDLDFKAASAIDGLGYPRA
ncbi:MAG: transcriptional coactivator/pterin dehydratase [Chloroflexi bacterium OLB15]|nr:MAG: transcriptional coactivator/pterin dehydratase [Chloroflexi bacterium OLB15]